VAERLPRLVYLAAKLGPEATKMPRELKKILPNFELYETVAKEGINAAAIALEIPRAQLKKLHDRGKLGGDGTMSEFRLMVAEELLENAIDDLPLTQRLSLTAELQRFVERKDDELVQIEEMSMSEIEEGEVIPKFLTGFTPLDLCLQGGGAYQGIVIVMAPPGTGKTSIMLSIMEGIHNEHPDWEKFFFEMEIPRSLMAARISPLIKRNPFKQTDKLFTGSIPIEDIEKKLDEFSNSEDRVVFVDGPDAMPGLGSESRRIELGHIYRRLVKIKERSRLVVVSSQPNRAGSGNLQMSSLAESWEKAWYADMIIGVNAPGVGRMRLKCLKNRFGQKDGEVVFNYDLESLSYDDPYLEADEW